MKKIGISNYIDLVQLSKNEPIYLGTKIRISHIIDDLAKRISFEEVLREHKELTKEKLQATFVSVQEVFKERDNWKLLSLF